MLITADGGTKMRSPATWIRNGFPLSMQSASPAELGDELLRWVVSLDVARPPPLRRHSLAPLAHHTGC